VIVRGVNDGCERSKRIFFFFVVGCRRCICTVLSVGRLRVEWLSTRTHARNSRNARNGFPRRCYLVRHSGSFLHSEEWYVEASPSGRSTYDVRRLDKQVRVPLAFTTGASSYLDRRTISITPGMRAKFGFICSCVAVKNDVQRRHLTTMPYS
jgi:hypothetical protein